MAGDGVSRWARRFVVASALFFVAWGVAALFGAGRRVGVALAVHGFVCHVVFGKAYSLVPSYFDRRLDVSWAPAAQLPLTAAGALGLAVGSLPGAPPALAAVGAVLWALGVFVFLGALAWTLRDNPLGAETATSEANADRRPVDRAANAFVPVALAYLAVGAYGTAARYVWLPSVFDGYPPRVTHLLAAGFAAGLVFAVGFRLLPRFLVVSAPRPLVAVVLPAGALGPALLAAGLPAGPLFRAGAALEATAVLAFAASYAVMFVHSDRRRVGFYGALAATLAGSAGVLLGVGYALGHPVRSFAVAHFHLNVLGFLGLTVLGVSYQFYPPAVGSFAGASDRTALAVLAVVAVGLLADAVGLLAGLGPLVTAGRATWLAGAIGHLYLISGLFYQRHGEPRWAPARLFDR